MPTTTSNGGPISYEVIDCALPWRNPAETIVFHHGLGACGAVWSGWTPFLIDSYRLVRFDMRGHGATPVPEPYRWSLQSMLDDLGSVIDAAGASTANGEGVHLVGESIGGTIVLAFAGAHPHRVKSVTVCNGAHAGGSIENVGAWADVIERGGMSAWSEQMMANRFYAGALSEAMRQWYEERQTECDPKAILEALTVLTQTDLSSQLGEMIPPVLLLHPDDSPFIAVEIMADLRRRLRNARLEVLPGTRHGLPFSHAGPCARSVRRFLLANS
ncbi:MAG: alpha/beta fold hydrolase [Gammaproteobacteria bacterium]